MPFTFASFVANNVSREKCAQLRAIVASTEFKKPRFAVNCAARVGVVIADVGCFVAVVRKVGVEDLPAHEAGVRMLRSAATR